MRNLTYKSSQYHSRNDSKELGSCSIKKQIDNGYKNMKHLYNEGLYIHSISRENIRSSKKDISEYSFPQREVALVIKPTSFRKILWNFSNTKNTYVNPIVELKSNIRKKLHKSNKSLKNHVEHNVPKKIIKNCNRKKIKINIHNKHGLSGVMNCSNMKFNLKNYTLEKLNSFNCAKFKTTPTIQRKRWKIDFYIPGCSNKTND